MADTKENNDKKINSESEINTQLNVNENLDDGIKDIQKYDLILDDNGYPKIKKGEVFSVNINTEININMVINN